MSISPLVFWAAGFVIIALFGLFISAKTIKVDLEKNGDLIVAMLTILGTLVSVLLGLLVSSADEQYRSMETCVSSEARGVNEVFRLARGLPPPTALILQERCIDYCDKVVADNSQAMRHGEMSAVVTRVYSSISDAVVQFRPANDGETNVQAALLTATSEVGQDRGLRIVACQSTWARRLLPLIFTCAIVVLACSYLYVGKGSAVLHSVLVGLVAMTLGTNIGVIYLMTRPFSSQWAVQPEVFEQHAKIMRQYMIKVTPGAHDQPASK